MERSQIMQGMKIGARNSASDAQRLQEIHDLAVQNGAECMGYAKAINFDYIKSLGCATPADFAVKSIGTDEIKGYAMM